MARTPLLSIFLVVFVDLVGFGVVIPLLPLYARDLHASGLEIGLLLTAYSFGQFIAAPYLGKLSDRLGRRPILTLSLVVASASYIVFGLADSLWLLFVSRTLAGLCGGNISTAQAYIADVTEPKDRARSMGLIGVAFGLGFVLGPAFGGLFAEISPSAPFFFAAGMSALAAVLCYTRLPEPERCRPAHHRRRAWDLLSDRSLTALILCFFVATFAFVHLETTFSLYNTRQFSLSAAENAYLFTYIGVIMVIVQGRLIGPITNRLGSNRTLVLGIYLLAVGFIALPYAPSIPFLLLALLPISAGNGLVTPSLLALISRAAPEGRQGETQGLGQSASGLARIIGPISAGLLYQHVSIGSAFTVAGLTMAVAWGLARSAGRHFRSEDPASPLGE